MKFKRDTKGQLCLEWSHFPDGNGSWNKRAYVQRRSGKKDWAKCPDGRYIVICSLTDGKNPGRGPDFPVFKEHISDEQALVEVVSALNAILGCGLPSQLN